MYAMSDGSQNGRTQDEFDASTNHWEMNFKLLTKILWVAYSNVPHIHTHQLIVWRQLDFNTSMVRVSRNTGLGKFLGEGGG